MMTRPPGDNWMPWMQSAFNPNPPQDSPFLHKKVEVWREGWDKPHVQGPNDYPLANAVGLYWRPVDEPKG